MSNLFKKASGTAVFALTSLLAAGLSSCSKNDDNIAGGVTDIGNSVASGIVVTEANTAAAHARIVAYYDNWDQTAIEDSVEVFADENGMFSLTYDSTRKVVLYAQDGTESGFSRIQNGNATVMVGHPRRLESSITAASSGYVRIVGSNEVAAVNADGSFAFDAMPLGKITLSYVAEKPQARFDFMTTVVGDTIKIPSLEKLSQNNSWLTVSDYRYYSGAAYAGIMVNVPEGITVPQNVITPQDTTPQDTTEELSISLELHMDGSDIEAIVYNNDGTVADDVNYVEGISGKGILLEVGQYIEVGEIDPCAGDFTFSIWTNWKGIRDSIFQVIFAERALWSDGTTRFQLVYDFLKSEFVALTDGYNLVSGYSELSKGSIDRGGPMPKETWAHLVLVYESGKLYFYVNGELASPKDGMPFTPKELAKPVPFRIGGSEIRTDTWNGIIDEVRIESTAHSAEWVKAEYEKLAK